MRTSRAELDAPTAPSPAPQPQPQIASVEAVTEAPTAAVMAKTAGLYIEDGRFDEALALTVEGLSQFPDDRDLLRAKGAVERRQSHHREAIATYERLLKVSPDDAAAPPILTLLLRQVAEGAPAPEAASFLQRAAELSPSDQPTLAAWCLAAAKARQAENVIAAYNGLDAANQSRPELQRAAADSYLAVKNFTRAVAVLDILLDLPGNRTTAETFVEAASHLPPDEGRAALARAAARHPNNTDLLRATAKLALDRREVWTGLNLLARVLALDPADGDAAGLKAALLADLGCFTLARECLDAHAAAMDAALVKSIRSRTEDARRQWTDIDAAVATEKGPTNVLTLAYGDVRADAAPGSPGLTQADLIRQLDYLKGHNFHFTSEREVAAARRHHDPLPARPVLLLVQGGYASFAQRVLPVLEQYNAPVVLAIPTAQLEGEASIPSENPLMNWDQLRTLGSHPLVTLASQTHDLGARVPVNPQGDLALASVNRRYLAESASYETAQDYLDRVALDLKTAMRIIEARTGRMTDVLIWPEGAFNDVTLHEAQNLDVGMMFARWSPGLRAPPTVYPALDITPGTGLAAFARQVWRWGLPPVSPRRVLKAMPLDLQAVVSGTPSVMLANLADAVERAVSLRVTRVYLTACADDNEDGAADAAYFPNRVLPVKVDLLSHAVHALRQRGLEVHLVMPSIGIQPLKAPDPRLVVMEYHWGRVTPSGPMNPRLSPFDAEACRLIQTLYEDLGAYVDFDGLMIGSDAFLTDAEDAGAAAAALMRERVGIRERNPAVLSPAQQQQRLELKITVLDALAADLCQTAKAFRPNVYGARFIAGAVVNDPEARTEFAQSFSDSLARFDGLWVDVTPERYSVRDADAWIQDLADTVATLPGGREKTMFAFGLLTENSSRWLSRSDWVDRVRDVVERGGRQITYFPDETRKDGLPKPKVVLRVHQEANEAAHAARD